MLHLNMKNFRYDINGLRAWAVISVIFYHFHLFKFTGGFAGVDVFFVISGFLMTKIITDELFGTGTFSLSRFYLFRAKRIIPPLFVLCIVLIVVGYYILAGSQYSRLSIHTISTLSFFSNFSFLRELGYFDSLANTKWLLHTWSLSVEWQFYLVLPIALVIAYKAYANRYFIKSIILLGTLLSFFCSVLVTVKYSPEFSFYMLPTRAWEMLAGGYVFLRLDNISFKERVSKFIEYTGFLLLAISFFCFNHNNVWPGYLAILPVSGAGLIIAAKGNSLLTSNKLFQFIGKISYSLYLWHWPIYVFIVYYEVDQNNIYLLIALTTTFICACASYYFVEVPSRSLFNKRPYHLSLGKVIMPVCIFLIVPWFIHSQKGYISEWSIDVQKILEEAQNKNPREFECELLQKDNPEKPKECIYGGKDLGIILLGDSHASAVVLALEKSLPNKNLHVLDWSILACPAALKYTSGPDEYKKCAISNQTFLKKSKNIPKNIPLLMVNLQNNEDRMEMACEIAKDRPVYLLRPTPVMPSHVPDTMAARYIKKKGDIRIKISIDEYNKLIGRTLTFQDEAAKKCGIKILETLPYLCGKRNCYGDKDGLPIYYDVHHLNLRGADLLIPEFRKIFIKDTSTS